MFLIFGFRTKAHVLGRAAGGCQVCGQPGSALVVRETTKFSLFFVPVLPVRSRYVLECQHCRSRVKISRGEANRLLHAGLPASY
ncbi:zinc-ribbon domain-containing protein [Cryptosporangium minutisporangium]|uniref:Zinc-ribbon 15 domain-containing protein n=1 Tax=Cryptosporangium minutisporangium TaxID=113569 RepID=A0ABP6T057_9ACTN